MRIALSLLSGSSVVLHEDDVASCELFLDDFLSIPVYEQIRKLRDCAPIEEKFYPDEEPAKALAAISVALKPWSSAPR